MKLLAHIHGFPPLHNAGAEWMLHAMLVELQEAHGIECRVIVNRRPNRNDTIDGIKVNTAIEVRDRQRAYWWADAVITHLDATSQATRDHRLITRPLVHLIHNHTQLAYHKVRSGDCDLAVFNSQWLRRAVPWAGRSMVCIPPVWPERSLPEGHKPDDGRPDGPHDRVTLLNLNHAKGAETFYALAELLPDVQFLGVKGAYGEQVIRQKGRPNVEIIDTTPDVASIYARTAVLLMPSSYESWGRCAVEAAWAHVPCLAANTPGLRETGIPAKHLAADDAQSFDGYKIEAWRDALLDLLDPDHNAAAGAAAQVQAVRLAQLARTQLAELASELRDITGKD